MPESVELNGMTINLVEDRATYDAMTKNDNELYLVGKDYDLVVEVTGVYVEDSIPVVAEIIGGDVDDLFDKFDRNPNYRARILVQCVLEYGVGDIFQTYEVIPYALCYDGTASMCGFNLVGVGWLALSAIRVQITREDVEAYADWRANS